MIHHDSRNKQQAEQEAAEEFAGRLKKKITGGRTAVLRGLEEAKRLDEHTADDLVRVGRGCGTSFSFDKQGIRFHWNDDTIEGLPLHANAITQMAGRLNFPRPSIVRDWAVNGADWQREMAADVLNRYMSHTEPERTLIRTVDEEVRGVLSENYSPWGGGRVITAMAEAVKSCDARMTDVKILPTRMYAEAYFPQVIPIETEKNGTEYIGFGVVYRTSDFGDGSECASTLIERLWCTNRAVSRREIRNIHLGTKLPDDITIRRQTMELRTSHHASLIGDFMRGAFSEEVMAKWGTAVAKAGSIEVDIQELTVRMLPQMGVTRADIDRVQAILEEDLPEQIPVGPLTRWKAGQALSFAAQTRGVEARYEMEEAAGRLLAI